LGARFASARARDRLRAREEHVQLRGSARKARRGEVALAGAAAAVGPTLSARPLSASIFEGRVGVSVGGRQGDNWLLRRA
jgi:hypothetical protein